VSNWLRFGGMAVWAGLWAAAGFAQQAPAAALNGTDSSAALTTMAGQAAVIFAGHVIAVASHESAGFYQVIFAVDVPIIGCGAAAQYELHEWAGLWSGKPPRYRVGQRLLMMLHAPGASGFSSPVNGLDGAIPLVGAGMPALMDASGSVATDAAAGGLSVDLGWVQARALRGAQAQTSAVTKRSVTTDAPVAIGAPLATPTAGLNVGDHAVVSLATLLTGLRGVAGGSR
jgi:hypothetical protein